MPRFIRFSGETFEIPDYYRTDFLKAALPTTTSTPTTLAKLHTTILTTLEPYAALLDALRANNAPITRPAPGTIKFAGPGIKSTLISYRALLHTLLPASKQDRLTANGLTEVKFLLEKMLELNEQASSDDKAYQEAYYSVLPRIVLSTRAVVDGVRDLYETVRKLKELEDESTCGMPETPKHTPVRAPHMEARFSEGGTLTPSPRMVSGSPPCMGSIGRAPSPFRMESMHAEAGMGSPPSRGRQMGSRRRQEPNHDFPRENRRLTSPLSPKLKTETEAVFRSGRKFGLEKRGGMENGHGMENIDGLEKPKVEGEKPKALGLESSKWAPRV